MDSKKRRSDKQAKRTAKNPPRVVARDLQPKGDRKVVGGKAKPGDLVLTHLYDKSSPVLFQ